MRVVKCTEKAQEALQLTKEQLAQIVDIQLARLQQRLAERKIELQVTTAAKILLAERGWDPNYGARPLKRTIQRLVADPLALLILEGRFQEGDWVVVDVENGELQFRKEARIEEAAALAGA
jgi:ATP-dependent Clp protease ATP-binding subunit ClpB